MNSRKIHSYKSNSMKDQNSSYFGCFYNKHDQNLLLAKSLFFSTAMAQVGWQRFQNNFYMDNGMSSYQIGLLKSIGLFFKFFAEPALCFLADVTSAKAVFSMCVVMQIITMEIFRQVKPLTFSILLTIKVKRKLLAIIYPSYAYIILRFFACLPLQAQR